MSKKVDPASFIKLLDSAGSNSPGLNNINFTKPSIDKVSFLNLKAADIDKLPKLSGTGQLSVDYKKSKPLVDDIKTKILFDFDKNLKKSENSAGDKSSALPDTLKSIISKLDRAKYLLRYQSQQGHGHSSILKWADSIVKEAEKLLKEVPVGSSPLLLAQIQQKSEEVSRLLKIENPASSKRDRALRKMGIDPDGKSGPLGLKTSLLPEVLGQDMTVPVKAVNVPGSVLYFNFELAKKLGMETPSGMVMTAEFEKKVIDALSYRILKKDEDPLGRNTLEVRADRYMDRNDGAGRAGILPYGNLQVKGIGQTPLLVDTKDFHHSHGGAPIREGAVEAVLGEVNQNLFEEGSTQILAIIDIGDNTEWKGSKEPRALIVRAGSQQRAGHLISWGQLKSAYIIKENALERFEKMAQLSRVVCYRKLPSAEITLDLKGTIDNIIKKHAETLAEAYRWRMIHGSLAASNTSFEGSLIDLATQTPQPRTAPITVVKMGAFGSEGDLVIDNLYFMLENIGNSLLESELKSSGLPFGVPYKAMDSYIRSVFDKYYKEHLQFQLLKATGMKQELAESLMDKRPELVAGFCNLLLNMMNMEKNVSSTNKNNVYGADKEVVDGVSVFDVYGALAKLPQHFFSSGGKLNPEAVRESFDILPSIANWQTEKAEEFIQKFSRLYVELLQSAQSMGFPGYEDKEHFTRSMITRAEFENKPLDLLYRSEFAKQINSMVDKVRSNGDTKAFQQRVDEYIYHSIRNIDKLLRCGQGRIFQDNVLEIEKRNMEGIDYSVLAYPEGKREIKAEIPVRVNEDGTCSFFSLAGSPGLSREQLNSLKLRYSTDGWESYSQAEAEIKEDSIGKMSLSFTLPSYKGQVGILRGVFHSERGDFWLKAWGGKNYEGYVFASPDGVEYNTLKEEIVSGI